MLNKNDVNNKGLKAYFEKVKKNIELKLLDTFGRIDIVEVRHENKKKRYHVKCPEEKCPHKSRSVESHLIRAHKWDASKAKQTVSEIIKTFNHITLIVKHMSYVPDLCTQCNRYVSRIDLHLVNFHGCIRDSEEFMASKEKSLEARSSSIISKCPPSKSPSKLSPKKTVKETKPKTRQYALTDDLKMKFGVKSELFKYYYKSSASFFIDFKEWLTRSLSKSNKSALQIVAGVKAIWATLDPEMSITKNVLGDPELLEDQYFMTHLEILQTQEKLPISKQQPYMKASTIQSKLQSLLDVIRFSKLRFTYIGLTYRDMEIMQLKINQLVTLLKPYRTGRLVFNNKIKFP